MTVTHDIRVNVFDLAKQNQRPPSTDSLVCTASVSLGDTTTNSTTALHPTGSDHVFTLAHGRGFPWPACWPGIKFDTMAATSLDHGSSTAPGVVTTTAVLAPAAKATAATSAFWLCQSTPTSSDKEPRSLPTGVVSRMCVTKV